MTAETREYLKIILSEHAKALRKRDMRIAVDVQRSIKKYLDERERLDDLPLSDESSILDHVLA